MQRCLESLFFVEFVMGCLLGQVPQTKLIESIELLASIGKIN